MVGAESIAVFGSEGVRGYIDRGNGRVGGDGGLEGETRHSRKRVEVEIIHNCGTEPSS